MARPYDPWPGCETMQYRPASGTSADWVDFNVQLGTQGRFMPPVAITTMPVPGGAGSRFLAAYHLERMIALPVVLPGPVRDLTDRNKLTAWARALDPARGLGLLQVVRGPRAPFNRQIECVYDSGLEGWEEDAPRIGLVTLVFRCPTPYWQDGLAQSRTVTGGGASRTWFPFLPLILGSTGVAAEVTVNNGGQVKAWPVITVVGPATSPIRVTNLTTGEHWEYAGSLAAGQSLVVDHRPGHQAATVDGANAFGALTPDSTLWGLGLVFNRISLSAAGTTSATKITLEWRNLYLTP